jgi:hypothetical protein
MWKVKDFTFFLDLALVIKSLGFLVQACHDTFIVTPNLSEWLDPCH